MINNKELQEHLAKDKNDGCHFETLEVNGFQMSIQASDFHYCNPRIDLKHLDNYDTVEVAVFKNNEWFDVESIKGMPQIFEPWYEGGTTVAGYVTMSDLDRIYTALKDYKHK